MEITKLATLTKEIEKIVAAHQTEIEALPTRGPRGGTNSANIKGWTKSPNAEISKAANRNRVSMNWWSGSAPTPATGIPECIKAEALSAYEAIYK